MNIPPALTQSFFGGGNDRMGKEMKVYCENCKYLRVEDMAPHLTLLSEWEGAALNVARPELYANRYIYRCIDTKDGPISPHKHSFRKQSITMLNENNNCKYYKRKWWKIWVKKQTK